MSFIKVKLSYVDVAGDFTALLRKFGSMLGVLLFNKLDVMVKMSVIDVISLLFVVLMMSFSILVTVRTSVLGTFNEWLLFNDFVVS